MAPRSMYIGIWDIREVQFSLLVTHHKDPLRIPLLLIIYRHTGCSQLCISGSSVLESI